jgi:hypothetical protein
MALVVRLCALGRTRVASDAAKLMRGAGLIDHSDRAHWMNPFSISVDWINYE